MYLKKPKWAKRCTIEWLLMKIVTCVICPKVKLILIDLACRRISITMTTYWYSILRTYAHSTTAASQRAKCVLAWDFLHSLHHHRSTNTLHIEEHNILIYHDLKHNHWCRLWRTSGSMDHHLSYQMYRNSECLLTEYSIMWTPAFCTCQFQFATQQSIPTPPW